MIDKKEKYKPLKRLCPKISNSYRLSRTVQKALKIINKKAVKKD